MQIQNKIEISLNEYTDLHVMAIDAKIYGLDFQDCEKNIHLLRQMGLINKNLYAIQLSIKQLSKN